MKVQVLSRVPGYEKHRPNGAIFVCVSYLPLLQLVTMQTKVKKISETNVQVAITLDAKELAKAEEVALARLAKTTKVKGFREGKVPVGVVEKNVNPQVLQETVLDTAINGAVAEAFLKEDLQAIDRPEVEVVKYVPKDVLEFTATAEVLPEVKLGDYKKLTSKPEKVTVDSKEVDEVVERIQQGFAEKKEVDRKIKNGDEVVIDFVGKKDGVAFDGGAASDHTLTIGSNQFIPGFEEGLVGHKAGEDVELNLEFPKDYHSDELAGQKVVFEVAIKKVQESIVPEADDELAKKAGPFENIMQLRAELKTEIKTNKEREAADKLKDALVQELVSKSDVIAPETLVADQMRSIEQDFSQNLLYRGLTLDSYINTSDFKDEDDWREKEVKPTAEKRVKGSLVLNALAKAEKVTATDEEIDEHVEVHKRQYANNPEALKQFESDQVRREIANHYVLEKTIDRLLSFNVK